MRIGQSVMLPKEIVKKLKDKLGSDSEESPTKYDIINVLPKF